eukprot:TRINITY_DN1505_c2_g1_i1.p1 TRINITY_DN1505_c2_g1~~TRINITY_DN1505_c2_g1_i1.p1  ORF type:complete len:175 (-),score=77.60 TRINITY_DN1505_c2_g1_i1:289-813(-)
MAYLTRLSARAFRAAACSPQCTRPAMTRGVEEFFFDGHQQKQVEEKKPVKTGRSWQANELRLKSYEDLHKLWYVLLKERAMLQSERERLSVADAKQALIPSRLKKVRISMARIKTVVGERIRVHKKELEQGEAAMSEAEIKKKEEEEEKEREEERRERMDDWVRRRTIRARQRA